MAYQKLQRSDREIWALARRQHGVVARAQLIELGVSPQAIKHRVAKGRLHPLWRGVYAVGRPELSQHGRWMAAILSCGAHAMLSHQSAAALWGIHPERRGEIEIGVPAHVLRRRRGITLHRRAHLAAEHLTRRNGIPVTSPACTLVDLAFRLPRNQLESAINEADKRDLIHHDALWSALGGFAGWPGVAVLRETIDLRTFTLTDSELERRFLPLVREAGLSQPETGRRVNGCKVDFYWTDLGLVVETDGLRYHRTPAQQARDRIRDQAHAAAGLTSLRFTHAQVTFEPHQVRATLTAVARRLERLKDSVPPRVPNTSGA
jgi:very-short-patch-repair endonuclease